MGETNLKLTADNSAFTEAMRGAQEAFAKAFEGMKAPLESFTSGFEKINGVVAKFTAILAGGAAFHEIIESTKSWGEGNIQLAKALGVSSEKATEYQVALQHLGIGNDVLVGASLALSKQIYNNAGAFEKAGIATKQSNGEFRAVGDVLQDVAKYLNAIRDPIERNIAGQQLLGKAYGEFRAILKLTNAEVEAAAVRAKELGLATNPEQIHEYMFAMRDTNLVVTALQNQLGNVLLPALTQIGRVFSETGPQMAQVFAQGLKVVAYIAGTVAIELEKLGLWFGKLGAQAAAFFHGNFAGFSAIGKDFDQDIERLNTEADQLWEKLNRKAPKAEEASDDGPGPHDFDSKEKSESQIAALEAVLNQKKIIYQADQQAHGSLLQFSYEQEVAYWEKVKGLASTNAPTRVAVERKIQELTLAEQRKGLEGKLETLKNEETEAGKSLTMRLAAESRYAEAVKGLYKADSKQYAEAQRAKIATQQQILEQSRRIEDIQVQSDRDVQLSSIKNAEATAKEQFELKRISLAQLVELQRNFEAERYQIELKGAADRLGIVDPDNPEAYAERLAQIRQLAESHQQQLLAIDKTANTQELALQNKLTQAMSQGFAQAFSGIIKGTETLHKAMTQVYSSILNLVIQTLSKMLAQFIATHLVQMVATKEQQTSDAAAGATAAGKSAAAIPVVGWALAIGAMASFFAAASGYSAEGGYDIPAGVNPMTQLHQREMVLPAKQADVIRDMADGGAGGSAGRGGGMPAINISAMGPRDVQRALMKGGTLEKAMKDLHRRMKR